MTTQPTLRSRAGRYLGDAARGLRRAPVEVLATLTLAAMFSWALEAGDAAFRAWAELAVACLLLVAVAWTGTLLHATGAWDATRRRVFTIGGGIVVAIYAVTVADFAYAAEAWRAAVLVGAAVLWLFALPAFAGSAAGRVERMRLVDGRILLRMVGALLYGGALFAGLALALSAVDTLFELSLDEEIYGHVAGWIFFALVPWIVLGGLPDYVRPAEEANAVAVVARRIATYLVPPLLALYYLILYAYLVRIVVTGEIPKNLVSPLVLAAGGLAALGLLLFDPRPDGRGLSRWLRLAPPLFLPPAALGAWAVLLRIEQYGLTEFRVVRLVVLAALVALAVGATVQLARRRPYTLYLAPLGLAAVLLLVAVGPWSAPALSRRSQQAHLRSGLAEVGIAPDDTTYRAPPDSMPREVPVAAYERIRGSARYLASGFGPDALPPVLRRIAAAEDTRWPDYAAELGLRPDEPPEGERFAMGGSLPLEAPIALEAEGATAYRVAWPPAPRTNGAARADSMRVALRVGGRVLYADLTPLAAALDRRPPGPAPRRAGGEGQLPAEQAVLPLTDSAGIRRGRLLVWSLWLESDSAGVRIGRMDGLAFVPGE